VNTTTVAIGLEPADIKRLGNAFCHAKLLLSASELGVFSDLHQHGPSRATEIGERLGLHPRGRGDFLYALVALGLLSKDGDRYANADVADKHLVPGTGTYMGGFLTRASRMLYPAWGKLTDALLTGQAQVPAAAPDQFERMLADPKQQEQYLGMMDSVNSLVVPLLVEAYDFSAHQILVDVGGARGNLAAKLVQAHPHLSAHVFDLPAMAEPLARHTGGMHPPVPVQFHGGNFFVDPLPAGDVLIIGHVLHNWSAEERSLLVKKAYASVQPGGALLVYDAMLDDEPTDLARILVSLNMLLVTSGGSEYPTSQCEQWLRDAGFADVTHRPLGTTDTLVIGHKA
jgi:hypothetical protein